MAEIERTTEIVQPVTQGVATERVVERTVSPAAKLERLVYYLFGLLQALLAIRVILSLLGANRGNGFADFIYTITHPFVAPFFGLFGYQFQYGVSRLEIETLVAMLVYALIGWGIGRLIRLGRA
jgi:hypothetical protein